MGASESNLCDRSLRLLKERSKELERHQITEHLDYLGWTIIRKHTLDVTYIEVRCSIIFGPNPVPAAVTERLPHDKSPASICKSKANF